VKIGVDSRYIFDISYIKNIGTGGKVGAGSDDKQAFF
jgi:hypothetical protein